jgi:hypothetical protein
MGQLPCEIWSREITPLLDKNSLIALARCNKTWRNFIESAFFEIFFFNCANCSKTGRKYTGYKYLWRYYCSEKCCEDRWKQRSMLANTEMIKWLIPKSYYICTENRYFYCPCSGHEQPKFHVGIYERSSIFQCPRCNT